MSKPFGTDIPSSTSAGLRVDAIRLVSAFANGTYTDQDALQASAMLRNLLEEIERLREELAAAQKDATRYWWVARNCDVWHATLGAIGSNRELDAAMAKESERE